MVSWENFTNIPTDGATVNWNWITPAGNSFANASVMIPSSSGGYLWYTAYGNLNIRGHQASTLTGTWHIEVGFNGAQITNQTFTIQSAKLPPPLTIGDSSIAMNVNSTTGIPANKTTSFSPSSPAVYSWLNFTNVPRPQQNVTWLFVMPNGTLYYNTTLMTTDPGAQITWPWWSVSAYIHVNGYQAANVTGTWIVDIYIDGRPSLVQNFSIS
jgi:hypothetical protein